MKRVLIVVALIVVVFVVAAGAIIAPAFVGLKPITDGQTIGRVRFVTDGMASIGVVDIAPGAVALVDTGNDPNGKALLAELARRQLGPDAVKAILITHGHSDHISAIHLFPGAQVIALGAEVPLIEGKVGPQGPLLRLFPVKPTGITVTQALQDGQTGILGQVPVRVYAVPGHTQGSAAYLIDGVLFLGDAAETNSAGVIEGGPWVFTDSQTQDRASLVRLDQRLLQENQDVKAIAFGHSGVLTQGLAPLNDFAQKNK